ncbi:hypothetical protein BPOR_0812g00050 [Botrytis porri]|uniref:Uncharacterized protein n=1 Tax=Botrytis porri TaxID=87229 RepID=A0A4Z1KAT2_9HELO|nr:hypothetical protein BPOR_0812g00050 [Botrytis porri]
MPNIFEFDEAPGLAAFVTAAYLESNGADTNGFFAGGVEPIVGRDGLVGEEIGLHGGGIEAFGGNECPVCERVWYQGFTGFAFHDEDAWDLTDRVLSGFCG